MCLNVITKSGLNESGVGWKVFLIDDNNRLVSFYYDWIHSSGFKENVWYVADEKRGSEKYKIGFHVYLQNPMVSDGITRRVRYRKGHTLGTDKYIDIIVADEMMILPEGCKLNIFQRLYNWLIKKGG